MYRKDAIMYRARVVRCFGGDHLQLASEEALRSMARPCRSDIGKVLRVAKHLNGENHRMQHVFSLGEDDSIS